MSSCRNLEEKENSVLFGNIAYEESNTNWLYWSYSISFLNKICAHSRNFILFDMLNIFCMNCHHDLCNCNTEVS